MIDLNVGALRERLLTDFNEALGHKDSPLLEKITKSAEENGLTDLAFYFRGRIAEDIDSNLELALEMMERVTSLSPPWAPGHNAKGLILMNLERI
ncbi:MAG TPA: hypothetical protein DDZ83_04410, partial [Nitrospinae bacterium]|nr:hypothetical protein [Nitrospinota bacterium]